MISYQEAKKKACEYYKDYDIISNREDKQYYIFAFGIKGEDPLPGMELIRIEKSTGELSTYNPFYEIQMQAPPFTEDMFKKQDNEE